MPTKIVKNVFNAGEINIDGRTDISKYFNGCSRMANATVLAQGGFTKRPGTQYLVTAKTENRLLSFSFSATDSMILEMGTNYVRFIKSDIYETITKASITNWATATDYEVNDIVEDSVGATGYFYADTAHTSGATFAGDVANWTALTESPLDSANLIYEIYSPYDETEVFEMHTVPSADVVYIAHEDFFPYKLTRLADNSWTLAKIEFDGGPFLSENTTGTKTLKITGSTHSGANAQAVLTDSAQAYTVDALVGMTIYNITNGESATITDNDATTITGALSGGESWDTNDVYLVVKNGFYIPAGTKNLTLTATGHTPFQGTSDDVETRWLQTHIRADNSTSTFVNNTNAIPTSLTNTVRTKGDYTFVSDTYTTGDSSKIWRKKGDAEWQEHRPFSAAVSYTATEDEDDVRYAITRSTVDINGTFTARDQQWKSITEVTAAVSTSAATVTAITDIYMVGGATDNDISTWAQAPWGEFLGFPQAVTFYEGRLWWAGSTGNPQTMWGSRSSLFQDHTKGINPDDALIFTINDNDVSRIQYLAVSELMIAGTANKEYIIGAANPDDPLSPADPPKDRPKSSHGSGGIQPVLLNDALFFAQGQGRKIRALRVKADLIEAKADDTTLLANHLFELDPIQFAVQRIPDSILWVVRSDGTLCSLTYEPEEEVFGWARQVTGDMSQNLLDGLSSPSASFESVAVIKGTQEDNVYVSVKRIVDGSTVRYIEKMSTRFIDQIDEAVVVDSAKTVESAFAAQNITFVSYELLWDDGDFDEGVAM